MLRLGDNTNPILPPWAPLQWSLLCVRCTSLWPTVAIPGPFCHGRASVPLSIDHKPDREDETQRIEAAGGKVMHWNGARVFGVLAMSRSIGDRYLKPWVIPDPEVMSGAKEDECLILARDGLWDVMNNKEACEMARKRILVWHKRNGVASVRGRRRDRSCSSSCCRVPIHPCSAQRKQRQYNSHCGRPQSSPQIQEQHLVKTFLVQFHLRGKFV